MDAVRDDIASLIESLGAHLVSLKLTGGKRPKVIEVYTDTEEGITADHLAKISKSLSRMLDTSEEISGEYRLIVSSPGLDAPLLHGWQYNRHKGRNVHIVRGEGDETEHIHGKIEKFEDGKVTVTGKKSTVEIPLEEIVSAKVIVSF